MSQYQSPELSQQRDLYANIMMEIRRRIDVVDYASSARYNIPPMIAYELCYLQFRLICELIALSCLAAHGDIPATKSGRLTKTYQADAILNMMEKLHPDFYPMPTRQVIDESKKVVETVNIDSGFLTKKQLISLYHETGELLHRGAMRDYKPRTTGDFQKIRSIMSSIVTLLNHHQIQLADDDYQLWVLMKAKSDDKVHVSLFQRAEGPPTPPQLRL